jgi:hypothetical protein
MSMSIIIYMVIVKRFVAIITILKITRLISKMKSAKYVYKNSDLMFYFLIKAMGHFMVSKFKKDILILL